MDVSRWKFVLQEWIKATFLIEASGKLEQNNLKDFYSNYCHRLLGDKQLNIDKFLEGSFPDFEILFNENQEISTQDYVYVFSLFLYHSCIIKEDDYFQKCCKSLEARQQVYIMRFFESMKANAKITKELIRNSIKEAAQVMSPPQFISIGSPMKTPSKLDRSPSPKKLNNVREFKQLKLQLDNERYERNMLEVEMKQNQEKIENLVQKCKSLSREVNILKNHMHMEQNDENSSPNIQREEHLRAKYERKSKSYEDTIEDLRAERAELSECKEKLIKRMTLIDQERRELLVKLTDFDTTLCELQTELQKKDEKIQYLEESNKELLQMFNETRAGHSTAKDASFDGFDCTGSIYHTGINLSGGENLSGIIELQLKDKESENLMLKELLASTNEAKDNLEATVVTLQETISTLKEDLKKLEDDEKNQSLKVVQGIESIQEKLEKVTLECQTLEKENKDLRNELQCERKFNNKVNENCEIMRHKLDEARKLKVEVEQKIAASLKAKEQEIIQKENQIKDAYQSKLNEYKNEIATRFEKEMEVFNKEKAELEQKNQNNIETIRQKQEQINDIQKTLDAAMEEIQTLKIENEFLQKKCKDLEENFSDANKENQYMRSKLKFIETNNERSSGGSLGMTDLEEETFNNDFLSNLKNGDDIDDLMSSSELQRRNQAQPAHLRDSYAVRNLDNNMNEKELKFGNFSGENSELPRKKLSRRPSLLPTPSRSSFRSSSSTSTLPSTKPGDKKEPTPSRKKIFGFSIGKDESQRGRRSSMNFARRKLKGKLNHKMDDEDSDEIHPRSFNNRGENQRKEKRRSAQDVNRPNLHNENEDEDDSSSSISNSTIIAEENEDDWLEEEERILHSPATNTKLDKSLEYFKHFEDFQKRTQKMRRRSFNSNRRSSSIKLTTKIKAEVPSLLRRTSSNDFEKFQSCLSLRSEGSFVDDLPHNRLKTVKKSFFDCHVAQVSRISDIYVPQMRNRLMSDDKSEEFSWKFDWKDVKKPFPLIVIALLTIAVLALFYYIFQNIHSETLT